MELSILSPEPLLDVWYLIEYHKQVTYPVSLVEKTHPHGGALWHDEIIFL